MRRIALAVAVAAMGLWSSAALTAATQITSFRVNENNSITFEWTPGPATCRVVVVSGAGPGIPWRNPCEVGGLATRTTGSFVLGTYRLEVTAGGSTATRGFTIGSPPPPPTAQCADGVNNDPAEDGLIDFPADPGCSSGADDSEQGNPPPPPPPPPPTGGIPAQDSNVRTTTYPRGLHPGATLTCSDEGSILNRDFTQLSMSEPGAVRYVLLDGIPVIRHETTGSSGDMCTNANGGRAESYRSNEVFGGGYTDYHVYGFRTTPGFDSNIMQMHSVHGGGPPPIDAFVDAGRVGVSIKLARRAPRIPYDVGPAPAGEWVYLVLQVRWTDNSTGFFKAWSAVGHLPDIAQPPAAQRLNYGSIYAPPGFDKVGVYTSDSNGALFFCQVNAYPDWGRASLMGNCPL
jgi:hypothetical protein